MSDDYIKYIMYLLIAYLLFYIISDYVSFSNDDYEGYVFGTAVSDESTYQVNLSSGVEYEFIVIEKALRGPLIIDVSISKGSYIPFKEKFRSDPLDTFKVYYTHSPPVFTVKENGTYQIHVDPCGSGSFKVLIKAHS